MDKNPHTATKAPLDTPRRTIYIVRLKTYRAIKMDWKKNANIGLISNGKTAELNAKQALADLIRNSGGDFEGNENFHESPLGKTTCGGDNYIGSIAFDNFNSAIKYLNKYFITSEINDTKSTGEQNSTATHPAKTDTTLHTGKSKSDLIALGFKDAGEWQIDGRKKIRDVGDDTEEWASLIKIKCALYAFCQDEKVLYIGKTARSIDKRYIGYRDPGNTKATNRKCHDHIREIIEKSKKPVRILIFADGHPLKWGNFKISLAAGLEDSLVEHFRPLLNGTNKKAGASKTTEFLTSSQSDEIEAKI